MHRGGGTGVTVKLKAMQLRRFHLVMMCIWALLLIPSLLWWKSSVLWVILLSVYANFMGHFSSWQGARAEDEAAA